MSKGLEKVFSIINQNEEDYWYKVINILGFSIRIRNHKKEFCENSKRNERIVNSLAKMIDFINTEPKENSVLLIEFNNCHYEIIPSYVKYLSELGFNVDVVVQDTKYSVGALNNIQTYRFDKKLFNILLASKKITQYKYIFVTSQIIYGKIGKFAINKEIQDKRFCSIYEHFPILNQYSDKLYVVEHHLDMVNKNLLEQNHIISLANMPILKDKTIVANPHYFGEINITPKNTEKTVFITIGALESYRRNTNLLIDTVGKLVKNNITNFEVLVIGRGTLEHVPKNIQKYIKILGRLDASEMYINIEKADFFLPLLDPDNTEHDRYITSGTSGSFQLIYGFRKPCLIAKKFAELHRFNNTNSIIYNTNNDLYNAMIEAIETKEDKYKILQENLNQVANDIYNESIKNLKEMLG